MTDKIVLELTLDELKTLDKYVELNDETESVFDKIKYAYPQPKMTLENEGEYAVVSYNDMTYYRLEGELSYFFCWYMKIEYSTPTLVMVDDAETERLLEGLYYNHIEVKKETAQQRGERVHNEMEEVVRESVKWCEENPEKNVEDYLTPKTPEETEESLKEAFREGLKQVEKMKEIQKLIDEEDNDKNFKNSLDLIKEWGEKNKPKTLYQLIEDWWSDIFCANSMDDMETCIDGLVSKIDKEFIPPSNEKNGYEWEKCLKIMRDKLR